MSFNWRAVIQQIANGEPVDQATANRAVVALAERTDWLKGQIENLSQTSGRLVQSNAPLHTSVAAGDWVYFDESEAVFKAALAKLDYSEDMATFTPAKESFVAGIVTQKISANSGTVLISCGSVNLLDEPGISDLADLLDSGDFVPGTYYLSRITPGKMTKNPTGAPLVPLGQFGDSGCTVRPFLKEVFESHLHHRFDLFNQPAASQGFGSSGWTSRDDGGAEDQAFVNYATEVGHEHLQLSIRRDATKAPSSTQYRVDIRFEGGSTFLMKLYAAPDYGDPADRTSLVATTSISIPDYGEEVRAVFPEDDIETDLIFSIIRIDRENANRYDNALSVDIAADVVAEENGWTVYLPNDYRGWTNANDQLPIPTGALFRYVTEGHGDLFAAFPPVPAEGANLIVEGALATHGVDWEIDGLDLYWLKDRDTGDGDSTMPWAFNFDATGSPSRPTPAEAYQTLAFTTNPLGPVESIVRSLRSKSNLLQITRLGGSQSASTGQLQIDLALGLAISGLDPIDATTALADILDDGNLFRLSHNVSQLVAGPNTRLARVMPDGSTSLIGPFVGKVRVEAVLPDFQGGAVNMTLFNAKESQKNGVTYVEFLPPDDAATAAVARIVVPNFDIGDNQLRLKLIGQWLGETAQSGSDAFGIFKAEFRIVRPGVNVSSALASPTRVEAWKIDFADGYAAFAVLGDELPGAVKQPASSENYNLFADDQILPNDQIFVRISREANDPVFSVGNSGGLVVNTYDPDNYTGSIGLVGLRWTLTLE